MNFHFKYPVNWLGWKGLCFFLGGILLMGTAGSFVYAKDPQEETSKTLDVEELRGRMESLMGRLAQLVKDAEADKDIVRSACVIENHERAKEALELGTAEVLNARDEKADQKSRKFSAEKLEATVNRIEELAERAAKCRGDDADLLDNAQGVPQNSSSEPRSIPVQNPSTTPIFNAVPPPTSGGWPPVASPIQ